MSKNIVHQYFKKEIEGSKILVKVNPIHYKGFELTVPAVGEPELMEMEEFDEHIFETLKAEGFIEVNAMEFNLYAAGLL